MFFYTIRKSKLFDVSFIPVSNHNLIYFSPQMDGLPLFRPTCLYCFTSLADELLLCECSAVICSKHSILHSNKKECTLLASLKIMADSSLAIHPYNNKINIPKLKQTILDRIKILEQDLKECHHPTKSLPSQTIIPESTSCSICSINDNL